MPDATLAVMQFGPYQVAIHTLNDGLNDIFRGREGAAPALSHNRSFFETWRSAFAIRRYTDITTEQDMLVMGQDMLVLQRE